MTAAKKTHWYNFPYILGLLPMVIPALLLLYAYLTGGAICTLILLVVLCPSCGVWCMVRSEVVRSLSVTYASPTTYFLLTAPGDSTRGGMVIGTIQSEEDLRNIQTHGVFIDCQEQENCHEISPLAERIKRHPGQLYNLLDPPPSRRSRAQTTGLVGHPR